jgi:prepilin-type N-terminal cleavage/methylation domain-containing protein
MIQISRARQRAFTLIELLVVIGIIALLISLVAAVGVRVAGSGKSALTEGAMQRMSGAYDLLKQASGDKLPAPTVEVRNPSNTTEKAYIPIVDGQGGDGGDVEPMNSIGLFILQLQNKSPDGRALVDGIDSSIVRTVTPHTGTSTPAFDEPHRELVTVFDAWQQPLRYVHPTFDGIITGPGYPGNVSNDASFVDFDVETGNNPFRLPVTDRNGPLDYAVDEIRRNSRPTGSGTNAEDADSDGGVCPTSEPYFYSAGPDGKVGVELDSQGNVLTDYNADNVYLVKPTFQHR